VITVVPRRCKLELFKALMQIYMGIAALNILLGIILWRVTKYRPSLYFTGFWSLLLFDAIVEGAGAQLDPYLRALLFTPHKLMVHYFLLLIPAEMLGIQLPSSSSFVFYLDTVATRSAPQAKQGGVVQAAPPWPQG
jgi:hypothetical protein